VHFDGTCALAISLIGCRFPLLPMNSPSSPALGNVHPASSPLGAQLLSAFFSGIHPAPQRHMFFPDGELAFFLFMWANLPSFLLR